MAVRQFRHLGEPLAALELVQAELPAHGPTDVSQSVGGMPDQRATLETQRERASVGLAFPACGWFEPV
jgi:hypothetical protein